MVLNNIKGIKVLLSEKENTLIEKLRVIPYGQVIIYMEAGSPVRIEKVTESVKL